MIRLAWFYGISIIIYWLFISTSLDQKLIIVTTSLTFYTFQVIINFKRVKIIKRYRHTNFKILLHGLSEGFSGFLWSIKIIFKKCGVKMCTAPQRTNYPDTTKSSSHLPYRFAVLSFKQFHDFSLAENLMFLSQEIKLFQTSKQNQNWINYQKSSYYRMVP